MADPAALDPGPGFLLDDGRYRLEELIGSGGMATVWRGTDRRLRRVVAVKLICEALADDPSYAARFAREARIAASLSHANLVQVYDYGSDGRRPFLVMEYVDGGTLAERIDLGPVRGAQAVAVAGDLLAALECIHAAGILHRDIKPPNVLLSSDGRARITDFGIAQPENATRMTQTGHLLGTLRYLAPEIIDGGSASRQSDLYALGVLLRDIAGETPDPATERVVASLTEALPGRRPRSADQARRLLREPARTRAFGRVRHPRPRQAAGRQAPPEGRSDGSRPSRGRIAQLAALGCAGVVLAAGAVELATHTGRGPAPRKQVASTTPTSAGGAQTALASRLDELARLVQAAGRH